MRERNAPWIPRTTGATIADAWRRRAGRPLNGAQESWGTVEATGSDAKAEVVRARRQHFADGRSGHNGDWRRQHSRKIRMQCAAVVGKHDRNTAPVGLFSLDRHGDAVRVGGVLVGGVLVDGVLVGGVLVRGVILLHGHPANRRRVGKRRGDNT